MKHKFINIINQNKVEREYQYTISIRHLFPYLINHMYVLRHGLVSNQYQSEQSICRQKFLPGCCSGRASSRHQQLHYFYSPARACQSVINGVPVMGGTP